MCFKFFISFESNSNFIEEGRSERTPHALRTIHEPRSPWTEEIHPQFLYGQQAEDRHHLRHATPSATADTGRAFQFDVTGGVFFNNQNMNFIDYKHFNGNQTILLTNPKT